MAAAMVEIVDAVVTALNSATLSQSFTAIRQYVPVHEIRHLVDLTVTVVPREIDPKILNRDGKNIYDYIIDVGIQKVIGQGAMTNDEINAACDPLMQLAQEIIDLFFFEVLSIASYPNPRCVDANNVPIFAPLHLDEKRIFTSIITMNFRLGM